MICENKKMGSGREFLMYMGQGTIFRISISGGLLYEISKNRWQG